MEINKIPIYTLDNIPSPIPTICVMVEGNSHKLDCCDITFYHGIGAGDGYSPHICVDDVDLYTVDYEELALELYNEWECNKPMTLNYFKKLAKKIILEAQK